MDINTNISALVQYGLDKKLIEPCDKAFIINQLLTPQQLDSFEPAEMFVLISIVKRSFD